MSNSANKSKTWALVLAGGQGSRLQGLTQDGQGVAVPKQFCSLNGGASLLQDALQRAAAVAELPQLCTVVTEEHRRWWTPVLSHLPTSNIIVQPQNRGTAFGILLPLLRIAERDPDATVVLLPADHYVRDEHLMAASLRRAAKLAVADPDRIYLLGVEPNEPDTELGYILPHSRARDQAVQVAQFVEKPTEYRARLLLEQGALWNIFILAGSVKALLGLFDKKFAATIEAMRVSKGAGITAVYQGLGSVDFSHDVLQGKESLLKVLAVPYCGWTDLGTPKSIGLTLERLRGDVGAVSHVRFNAPINLADRFARVR
ncbi:MAG: mannose-phosphate guanylyltransferase [Gammaproteobacteria bacterium]|jgi:mannose-1-phosphate guanylyltransferase|nr:mannose-phosphate guanylyltransferase [Gammaproteobacteria bacterium]